MLGGKVAWIFGAIFHMFSHPVYIVYRQDWDFIENKFLAICQGLFHCLNAKIPQSVLIALGDYGLLCIILIITI